ncbi:MAG: glucosamine-6-phosphate deaminase [Opitutaceae bacterium]|nr:glucosamine-6-phosphate deaminase [Opitutaceae bacterium]
MTAQPEQRFLVESLSVEVHPTPGALGLAAARAAASFLRGVIDRQGGARVIFACAPSQDAFLAALVQPGMCGTAVDWNRVTAFHMDDYIGLKGDHPQSFRSYLRSHFLTHVDIGRFFPLEADDADCRAACARYADLLRVAPIDLVCMGVGENGHIAFNDPPVADFDDPEWVKVVELDEACRQQQVNDGCFSSIGDVPRRAITLTIPNFRQARRLSIHVHGLRKAAAVRATLRGPLTAACPASILRTHPQATLYLDRDAASKSFS